MRRLLMLLIALTAPAATAGTVLTYSMGDEADGMIIVVEIQDGRVRWEDREYGEWEVFDPAGPVITEYDPVDRDYREQRAQDGGANPDGEVAGQPVLTRLGEMPPHNGVTCVMYAYEKDGWKSRTCLADAAALGIPAEDVAALKAFANFARQLEGQGYRSMSFPVVSDTASGFTVMSPQGYQLIKFEQRDVPLERFETPPDYKRFEPGVVHGHG